MKRFKSIIKQINCTCGACGLCKKRLSREKLEASDEAYNHARKVLRRALGVLRYERAQSQRRKIAASCDCGLRTCKTCYGREKMRNWRARRDMRVYDRVLDTEIVLHGRYAKECEPEEIEVGTFRYQEFPIFASEVASVIRRVQGNKHRTLVGATM